MKKKRMNPGLKRFLIAVAPWWLSAGVLSIGMTAIIDTIYPRTPVVFTIDGVMMFMGICAGIGWVIHGTGFLLVRVK